MGLQQPATAACQDRLGKLRSEIDDIDDALLALIDRRLAIMRAVADRKRDADSQTLLVRPRREAAVIARIGKAASLAPPSLIRAIWRELMSHSLDCQQLTRLLVYARRQPILITDLTRQRFGCAAPLISLDTPGDALKLARESDAIAIVELDPSSGWWTIFGDTDDLRIFDVLRDMQHRIVALAVGRVAATEIPPGAAFPILSQESLDQSLGAEVLATHDGLHLCAIVTGDRPTHERASRAAVAD